MTVRHCFLPFAIATLGLAAAGAHAAVLPPPKFVCPQMNPAPAGAVGDVNTVLTSLAVSETDRGNQPRWESAIGATALPTAPTPAATLPALAFTNLAGTEISSYPGGLGSSQSLTTIGYYPYPTGFDTPAVMYFRFPFTLDPTVDPAGYTLTLSDLWADDGVYAVYVNGARWTGMATGTAFPTQYGSAAAAASLVGGANGVQWKTGANNVVVMVYDSGGGAVRLRVGASSSACAAGPVALTVAQAPTVLASQAVPLSGTVSGVADGTQIAVVVTDSAGTAHSYTATASGGTWSVNVPAGDLPNGPYTVSATTPTGVAATTKGEVLAPALAPSPVPAAVPSGTAVPLGGTVTNVSPGTSVTVEILDAAGAVVQTATVQTDASGNYTAPAVTLPPGSYTVRTSAAGVTATQPLTVNPPAPAPGLTPDALPAAPTPATPIPLAGTLTNAPAGTTVTIVITGDNGTTRTVTATTDANGHYSVAGGTLPAGTYTVVSSAPGAPSVTQTLVVRAAVVQPVPTLGHGALALLGALLTGAAALRRRRV